MDNRKLKIGIIGAGGFAEQHMEAFAEIPDAEVVAFMRRSEGPLREMQERWGVSKGYTDHREMLDDPDIDAIDIITPTDSHKSYALDAIASGRPVLCEKPLALNAADCQEMLDAAQNAGVIHAVNFNQRGRTPVGKMKRYIDAGYVGDVYHVNIRWGFSSQQDARPDVPSWRFLPEHGGGSVYELIHVFDMARFLNGEVARVSAVLNTAEKHRQFIDAPEGFDVKTCQTHPRSCSNTSTDRMPLFTQVSFSAANRYVAVSRLMFQVRLEGSCRTGCGDCSEHPARTRS